MESCWWHCECLLSSVSFEMSSSHGPCSLRSCSLWTIVVYFDQEHNPWRIMLWISCVWCPLVTGAIWAGWGTLHATPSAFSKPSISSSGRRHVVRSFIRKPWVINILCLSTPVLQFVSVMIPGIIANARTDSALQMYLDWLDRYGTATELSPDMLREAQQLWFKAASGAYISAVLMTIWSAWAGVFLIFYGLTGAFLIRIVRRQISRIRSLERKQNALDPYRAETPPSANFKHKSGLDSDGVMFTRQQIESDLPHTSFFPSIKPSGVIKSTPKAKSSPSVLMAAVGRKKAHPRARYLEKVNKNFSVQYSGIVSATAAFTGLAIYWSCSIYDAYEHNTVGALFMRAILWASWASCL